MRMIIRKREKLSKATEINLGHVKTLTHVIQALKIANPGQ